MPLCLAYHESDFRIAFWRLSEHSEELTKLLPESQIPHKQLLSISNEQRKREVLACRHLLIHLLGKDHFELDYSSYGKPLIANEHFSISFSHASDLAAVAIHPKFRLGFDLEICRSKAFRLRNKFLSTNEQSLLYVDPLYRASLFWSVKESMYKWYEKKNISFIQNLLITAIEGNRNSGIVHVQLKLKDSCTPFSVPYFLFNNNYITYCFGK